MAKTKISNYLGKLTGWNNTTVNIMGRDVVGIEEIEYNITISNKEHLLKLLKEGELDVIIIDTEHIVDSNLEIISIYTPLLERKSS